jgi:hypothetical protein
MRPVIQSKPSKCGYVTFHNHFQGDSRYLQGSARTGLAADSVGLIPPPDCSNAYTRTEGGFLYPDYFIGEHGDWLHACPSVVSIKYRSTKISELTR